MNYRTMSGLSTGAVLVTVGAILYFAVTAEIEGFDITAAGAILMIVGFIVALVALIWGLAVDMPRRDRVVRTRRVDPAPPPTQPVVTQQPQEHQRVVSETHIVEQ